jgi:D-aminopeptidase
MVEWMLAQPGMENVGSINAVVGETNDGGLNDIRSRPITPQHVRSAIESAATGPVAEGVVGAGTGTQAFGWKGGIGTSSRVLPESMGGYTVGVLIQSNFGGILYMGGAPVGMELGQYAFSNVRTPPPGGGAGSGPAPGAGGDDDSGMGSIMMVVATDAPIDSRNLERLAARAIMGLSRTGSYAGNGSGDYVIAFSTAESVRRPFNQRGPQQVMDLPNNDMNGLFQATLEATEEAIYNSLLKATDVTARGRTSRALPIAETVAVLKKYGVVKP